MLLFNHLVFLLEKLFESSPLLLVRQDPLRVHPHRQALGVPALLAQLLALRHNNAIAI